MLTPNELLQKEWTEVSVITVYTDKGRVAEQTQVFTYALDPDDERPEEMVKTDFKRRVLAYAEYRSQNPIFVDGTDTSSFRVLPPWAVKEVRIEVHNLGTVLLS